MTEDLTAGSLDALFGVGAAYLRSRAATEEAFGPREAPVALGAGLAGDSPATAGVPRQPGQPDRQGTPVDQSGEGRSDPPTGSTVLLVEDNQVNQKVAMAFLVRAGYDVDLAFDGADALEKLGQRSYVAVLMDCQMPVMDGYHATREMRRREGSERHTPVIAMTASAMSYNRARCLASGMDDFLTKPIRAERLTATLRRWTSASPSGSATDYRHPAGETPSSVLDRDLIAGLRELGGPNFLLELIATYRESTLDHLGQIDQGIRDGNASVVGQAAHAISGASASLGAACVAAVARELERCAVDLDLHRGSVVAAELALQWRQALYALSFESGSRVTDTAPPICAAIAPEGQGHGIH